MNPGGDAAEQVVHMSLEGMEVMARITGAGAKEIGLKLYTALKQEQKTKGRARLTGMLKSGKELKVYSVRQSDLRKFSQEARRYGVLYCVLRDRANSNPEAPVDIIARAEDASKIQRITERFRLVTVDAAYVIGGMEKDRDRLMPARRAPENPLQARADKSPPSVPDSKKQDRSNGSTRPSGRASVREKLAGYRREIDRSKEQVKTPTLKMKPKER